MFAKAVNHKVGLSHGVFHADQVTIWVNEFELGQEYSELVQEYAAFSRL